MTPPTELDRLLSGLCDGTLSADDLRLLGEAVAADPAARARYLQYLDLHAALGGPAGADLPEPAAPRPVDRARRWRWVAGPALAAAAALAAWLALRPGAPVGPRPDALPREVAAVRFAEVWGRAEVRDEAGAVALAEAGTPLRPGLTIRTEAGDGFATLDLGGGSRVELGPDAQLRVAEDMPGAGLRLVLSAGLLRGDLRAAGVTVVTTQAEVRARDARFLVSAVTADATDVEAESGTVRAVRTADGQAVDVPAGSGAVIAAGDAMGVRPAPVSALAPAATHKVQAHWGLAFTPDGRRLVVRLKANRVAVVDRSSGTVGPGPALPPEKALALSADGRTVLLGRADGRVERYDTASGAARGGFDAPDAVGAGYAVWGLSADGRTAAVGYHTAKGPTGVRVWTEAGPNHPAVPLTRAARAVALSDDGKRAAWAVDQAGPRPVHTLTVWDVTAGRVVTTILVPARPLRELAFTPDGRRLAGATDHGAVYVWEADGGQWVAGRGPDDGWARPVTALAFSPDGKRLAAGRSDGRVYLWDTAGGTDAAVLTAGTRPITGLAFSPDGSALAAGPLRESVCVWDLSRAP
ncbi:MAG: hypothetical protein C0501_20955 [Isosphaera sp.]|nr:hypothetical protein [Isosphaera sp.]